MKVTMRWMVLFTICVFPGEVFAQHRVMIDFEDFRTNALISNQFSGVTFSSTAGSANFAQSFISTQTGQLILCSGTAEGSVTCEEDTFIDFAHPVNNLKFLAVEANFVGITATFRIFEAGVHTTNVSFMGGGGSVPVDLSAFVDVTRLEIVDVFNHPTKENGIGWDNFSFEVGLASTFCTAKQGLLCGVPSIVFRGRPSASAASGFYVEAGPVLGNRRGALLYNTAAVPGRAFQGGTLCVAADQIQRTGSTDSRGTPGHCDGVFSFDLNAFAVGHNGVFPTRAPADFLSKPGTTVFAQYWGWDSAGTGSFISNGLSWTIRP